jgi:hypothetical protein
VLVVKAGAHWEGSVIMSAEAAPRAASQPSAGQAGGQAPKPSPAPEPAAAGASSGQGSIFSKQDREGAAAGERQATGPGND